MSTLRSTLGKFALPLAGVWFVLTGLTLITSLVIPALLMGSLALIVGICLLCAS